MRSISVAKLASAISCVLIAASMLAQKPTPSERINHVAEINSLDSPSLKPWHLKLSYELFDSDGKPEVSGTVEKWWASPGHWRLVLKQGDTPLTIVSLGRDIYRSDPAGFLPSRVDMLMRQIEHPVESGAVAKSTPEIRKQSFGKLKTDCIMLSDPIKGVDEIPLGIFPTFCVNDQDVIRVSWLYGNIFFANDQTGTFQGQSVPVKMHATTGSFDSFRASLDALSVIAAEDVPLSTDGLTEEVTDHATRIGSGVIAGLKTGGPVPRYPAEARMAHISGTVVLHAVIGRDGQVHSLHVVSSPDGSLSIAALAAVERWTYKPYLLQGVPMEVDTTITVNFKLN